MGVQLNLSSSDIFVGFPYSGSLLPNVHLGRETQCERGFQVAMKTTGHEGERQTLHHRPGPDLPIANPTQ